MTEFSPSPSEPPQTVLATDSALRAVQQRRPASSHTMTIEELATQVGMTVRNIRAYNSAGLLPPPTLRGRLGLYGEEHLAQLQAIRMLRNQGLSLERIKALNPEIYCGMLYESVLLRPWRYAKDNKMNAVHPRFQHVLFMPDFCARAHRAGIEVNVWTVNSERDMKRVIEAGVDMIITNYPDRARALLNL